MKFEGEKKVVKVACVGDSITYGATSTNDQQNYPNYLQEMLGLDYHVLNAGISGYSIVSTDQYAYKSRMNSVRQRALSPTSFFLRSAPTMQIPHRTSPIKIGKMKQTTEQTGSTKAPTSFWMPLLPKIMTFR
jgi:hypothetical protein